MKLARSLKDEISNHNFFHSGKQVLWDNETAISLCIIPVYVFLLTHVDIVKDINIRNYQNKHVCMNVFRIGHNLGHQFILLHRIFKFDHVAKIFVIPTTIMQIYRISVYRP